MKRLLCTALLVTPFLAPQPASAQYAWTGSKKVTGIEVVQHGGFIVWFDGEVSPACTQAGTDSIYVYPGVEGVTNEGVKSLLSTALSAMTMGWDLNAMYNPETAWCYGRYLNITR